MSERDEQDAVERLTSLAVSATGIRTEDEVVARAGVVPAAHGTVNLKSPNFLSKKSRKILAYWSLAAGLAVLASSVGLAWTAWAVDRDDVSANVLWMTAAGLLASILLLLISLIVVNGYGEVEISGGSGNADPAAPTGQKNQDGQQQMPPVAPVPEPDPQR